MNRRSRIEVENWGIDKISYVCKEKVKEKEKRVIVYLVLLARRNEKQDRKTTEE